MSDAMELAFEERGSGPTLLFVHGFPLDRTMWIPQLSGLAKVRTCMAVDLRGHGLSADENPNDYSMDLFADDIAATLDSTGVDKVDLCGLSMGGYVLFAFWRRHPARVRSLIFIDTKAEADTPEGKAGREKIADLVASKGMEPLHADLDQKMFGAQPADDVRAKVKGIFLNVPPEVAAADALAMRDRPDSSGDLAGITVPVLWLHGEEDKMMPIDAAKASAAKVPGAQFVSIPGAGHMSSMENPDAVNAAIREFLKNVPK